MFKSEKSKMFQKFRQNLKNLRLNLNLINENKVPSNLPEFTTNSSYQPVYYMPIFQQPLNKAKSKTKA